MNLVYKLACLVMPMNLVAVAIIQLQLLNRTTREMMKDHFGNNTLLVIAHPDDETMFFGPLILNLMEADKHLKILCLSHGDYDNLGSRRSLEMAAIVKQLGHRVQFDMISDKRLPDSINKSWDAEIVGDYISMHLKKRDKRSTIVTFDSYGVSGHPNHRSIYYALEELRNKQKDLIGTIYQLRSVSIARKYISFFDILIAYLPLLPFSSIHGDQITVGLNFQQNRKLKKLLSLHKSQMIESHPTRGPDEYYDLIMDVTNRAEQPLPTTLGHVRDLQREERFELLILSEAGKPIYAYTKREDAVTLMPLCSALINYASKTQKESLKCIKTSDGLVINFATRSPLIIIVIHEVSSYVDPRLLIEQVEAQIVSILTIKTLKSVFEDRPTFDLKRLLYGSEKLIDATTDLCAFPKKLVWPWIEAFLAVSSPNVLPNPGYSNLTSTPSATLPARPHRLMVPIVIIPSAVRDNLHNSIQNVISSSSKNLVFTLLFKTITKKSVELNHLPYDTSSPDTDDQNDDEKLPERGDILGFKLMTVCNHHDRHKIKTADILIVLALLSGSRVQLASVESLWMPICLPKFNQDAFLHSYISYMNDNKHCLVLMSVDRDEFSKCQKSRNLIENKLAELLAESSQRSKLSYTTSPLVHPVLVAMQDRLISQPLARQNMLELEQKIQANNIKQDHYLTRQLQFLWYQTNKQVLWWQRSNFKSISPVMYHVTKKMLQGSLKHLWLKIADDTIFLGWHMPSFQLYAQFDATITTLEATEVIQRITNWIKKEEDSFSIKDYR